VQILYATLLTHYTCTFAGGPSLYNDNQGIKMTIVFTPLHQPLEARKKRRANAKPTVITKIDHFYEALPLRDFLAKAIGTNLKREDLFEHSWIFQGQELEDGDSFSLSYTIPRRVTDQVEIDNDKDYAQMVDEATNKAPCEVKLFIVKNQVCFLNLSQLLYALYYNVLIQTGNMGDEPEEEAEHEEAAASRKKQKVRNFMRLAVFYFSKACRLAFRQKKRSIRQKLFKNLNAFIAVKIGNVARHHVTLQAQMPNTFTSHTTISVPGQLLLLYTHDIYALSEDTNSLCDIGWQDRNK
jgi:hypothetical protein